MSVSNEAFQIVRDKLTISQAEALAMRRALEEIQATPYSMVNNSESLRHTLRTINHIATTALK